jgi:hypothetical protein
MTKMMRNKKKRTLEIVIATPSTPLNPNKPAMSAMIKKIIAHLSMFSPKGYFSPF